MTGSPDGPPSARVDRIRAHYFAIAENDDQKDPEAKTVLRDVFAAAGLPAEIEVYAGPCTAGARPIPPCTTKRRRSTGPGAGCWRCSRPLWPELTGRRFRRQGRRRTPFAAALRSGARPWRRWPRSPWDRTALAPTNPLCYRCLRTIHGPTFRGPDCRHDERCQHAHVRRARGAHGRWMTSGAACPTACADRGLGQRSRQAPARRRRERPVRRSPCCSSARCCGGRSWSGSAGFVEKNGKLPGHNRSSRPRTSPAAKARR